MHLSQLKVKDIMTRHVITVHEDTSVADVVSLFQQHHVGGFPVIDKAGRLKGIVTESDLFPKAKRIPFSSEKLPFLLGHFVGEKTMDELHQRAKETPVREVMTTEVITVTEETSLKEAGRLMFEKDLERLPVIREEKVVGIVCRVDLMRAAYNGDQEE